MHPDLLRNLSELAERRAINLRDEAQLWDILSRDLKREARRQPEIPSPPARVRVPPGAAPDAKADGRLFVRIPEAARMMGIGRSSLYKEINAGRLKVRKSGRMTLIAVADVGAWCDGLSERSLSHL